MRYVLYGLGAMILGIFAGVMTTKVEFRGKESGLPPLPHESADALAGRATTEKAIDRRLGPRVEVVNGETHDFGSMDAGSKASHTFVLRNVGVADLTLVKGPTTCKCTTSDLDTKPLPPGGVREVTLTWETKSGGIEESSFQQSAEIKTNDPDRETLALIVKGKVSQGVFVDPREVRFGSFSPDRGATGNTVVLFTSSGEHSIEPPTFADKKAAEHFEIDFKPLEHPEQHSLAQGMPRATAAYTIAIRTKPTIPMGEFRHTLRIKTNDPKKEALEVTVDGRVEGAVSLTSNSKQFGIFSGGKYEARLGVIDNTRIATVILNLTCRGELAPTFTPEVAVVEPAGVLQATIQPLAKNDPKVANFIIRLQIPKGQKPIDRLGPSPDLMGKVVIKTNHPDMPEATIQVKFAITDESEVKTSDN